MRIILQPYLSIQAASPVVNLSESVLRRGCRDDTIPHIRHNGRLYIDMLALLDALETDKDVKQFEKKG